MIYNLVIHAERDFDMESERVIFKHRLINILEDFDFEYDIEETELEE